MLALLDRFQNLPKTFVAPHRQLVKRLTESFGGKTAGKSGVSANDMEITPLSCVYSQVKTLNISEQTPN